VKRPRALCVGAAAAFVAVMVLGVAGCGGTKAASVSPSPVAATTGPPGGPPMWVQNAARSVAAESDSPKPASCEWTLTTVKRAASMLGLTPQDPIVKPDPDLKVFIIIEHGMFSSSKFGASGSSPPPPATWYVSCTDAAYKRPLRVGLLYARPDTSSVGKMNLFTF
jgi:hypothetical protein